MSDNTVILGIRITGDATSAQAAVDQLKAVSAGMADVKTSVTQATANANDFAQSLRQLSQADRSIGQIASLFGGGKNNVIAEGARAAAATERLTATLSQLGSDGIGPLIAQVGPAIAITAAFSAAIAELKSVQETAKNNFDQFANSLAKVNETAITAYNVQNDTTAALQKQADAQQQNLTELERQRNLYQEQLDLWAQQDIAARAADEAVTHYQQNLRDGLGKINANITIAQQNLNTLGSAAVLNTAKLKDEAEAAHQAMTKAVQDTINDINADVSSQIGFERMKRTGTVSSVTGQMADQQGVIKSIDDAILNDLLIHLNVGTADDPRWKKIADLLDRGDYAGLSMAYDAIQAAKPQTIDANQQKFYDELDKLVGQATKAGDAFTQLNQTVLPFVEARTSIQEVFNAFTKAGPDVLSFFDKLEQTASKDAKADSPEFSNILKNVTGVLDEAAKVAKSYADSVKKITDTYQQGVAKLDEQAERDATQHATNLERIQRDEQQRETDIINQYNEQRQQTLAKRALDEARIMAQQQLDLKNLAASGDVAAFVQKEQQDQLENDSRHAQYQHEDQQQAQHLEDQLNAERENAQKQIQAENDSYAQRQQALADQLEALKQHEQDQMDVLNQSHNDQLTALQNHESNILNINSDIYKSIESMAIQAQNFWSMVQNAANQTTSGSAPPLNNVVVGGGTGGFSSGQTGLILHVHNASSDIVTRAHLENAKGEMLQLVAQSFDMAPAYEGSV